MSRKLVIQKDNHIIQNTINKFSYKQNQLMCVLLGKYVHTKNNECIDTTISINELRKALGLSADKDNLIAIKKAVNAFGENGSVGVYEADQEGNWRYVWRPFFTEIELNKTRVKFAWNPRMKEHLVNLKGKYTAYLANDYLKLNSIYSQNLYEQMKSYQNIPNRPQVTFSIDHLHRIMQTQDKKSYESFNKFKTTCIERAVNDINANTDIFIQLDVVRDTNDKRKAVGIAFTIHTKEDYFNYNGCWLNAHEINEIIYKHKAKHKIIDLANIKKEKPDYYTLLRHGDKSDYQIIINFIRQDKLDQGESELSEDDKQMQLLAEMGNLSAQDYCDKNGIPY